MSLVSSNDMTLAALAALCACVWGLVCGVFERVFLAPRRRLSSLGPAYAPAMTLAVFGGCMYLTDQHGMRFFIALLMAALYFLLGALPALATFYVSRWILRTRFSDDTKSSQVA